MVAVAEELIANEELRRLVAGWDGRVSAALVYDGGPEIWVPTALGKAKENQLQGTVVEQVIEVAGRTCYDSLGKGRSSAEYHGHLLDVRHWSVHEHPHHTIEIKVLGWLPDYVMGLINRPGVWTRAIGPDRLRITLDPRSVLEWHNWTLEVLEIAPEAAAEHFAKNHPLLRGTTAMGILIKRRLKALAPVIFGSRHADAPAWAAGADLEASDEELLEECHAFSCDVVEPETPREEWVTLYLTGSRGWSHELVRHGDFTAISQRSTRYVDENEGSWVLHPVLGKFLSEPGRSGIWKTMLEKVIADCRGAYSDLVGALEAMLLPGLLERKDPYAKQTARKQARGAARGVLGNALETEVIFSFTVAQGLHMMNMRGADAADAEIRMGFTRAALPALMKSRFAHRFSHIKLAPASDGLGMSLVGGGAK